MHKICFPSFFLSSDATKWDFFDTYIVEPPVPQKNNPQDHHQKERICYIIKLSFGKIQPFLYVLSPLRVIFLFTSLKIRKKVIYYILDFYIRIIFSGNIIKQYLRKMK